MKGVAELVRTCGMHLCRGYSAVGDVGALCGDVGALCGEVMKRLLIFCDVIAVKKYCGCEKPMMVGCYKRVVCVCCVVSR